MISLARSAIEGMERDIQGSLDFVGEKKDSMATSTYAATAPSTLLGLPFELRRRILEYVFQSATCFPPRRVLASRRLGGIIVSFWSCSFLNSRLTTQTGKQVQAFRLCAATIEPRGQHPSPALMSTDPPRRAIVAAPNQHSRVFCNDG